MYYIGWAELCWAGLAGWGRTGLGSLDWAGLVGRGWARCWSWAGLLQQWWSLDRNGVVSRPSSSLWLLALLRRGRYDTRSQATTVLCIAFRTCGGFAFETRRHDSRPESTTILCFVTRVPPSSGTSSSLWLLALLRRDDTTRDQKRRQFCISRPGLVVTAPRHTRMLCERFANACKRLRENASATHSGSWAGLGWAGAREATLGRVPCGVPP